MKPGLATVTQPMYNECVTSSRHPLQEENMTNQQRATATRLAQVKTERYARELKEFAKYLKEVRQADSSTVEHILDAAHCCNLAAQELNQ